MYTKMLTTSLALSTFASLALAQGVTHDVSVGVGAKAAYSPDSVVAAVGDVVRFNFNPKNHTATQSTFANPCLAIQKTTGVVGFDSGL